MKIAQLRTALKSLPQSDSSWATAEAKEELIALDRLLAEADEMSLPEFCSAVKMGKPKRKAKEKADPKPSATLVAAYLQELRSASADADAFASVAKRLEKDKAVRLVEAKAIALDFAGDRNAKTKRDAFKSIRQRRTADARSDNRRTHIGDIF